MQSKILLVDDDDGFRAVAALALEHAGYAVVQVADGFAALEWLERERPDAIICDLNMPLMDGRALLKRVRAEAGLAEIPFVILSAFVESEESGGPGVLSDLPADYCFSKQDPFSSLIPQLEVLIARKGESLCES
jgi:CheY-like chemotaxis protein